MLLCMKLAVEATSPWCSQWLVEHGPGDLLTSTNNYGNTPLHLACDGGHLAIVQWLVEHGAVDEVTSTNNYGKIPLHLACFGGHLTIVQWLVEHGPADQLSSTNNNGDTPLHLACWKGYLAVVQWLLEHGAADQITSTNDDGDTPTTLALFHGQIKVSLSVVQVGGPGVLDDDSVREEFQDQTKRDPLTDRITDSLAPHASFKRISLFGMSRRSGSPHLPQLEREVGLRMLLASFLGVPTGQGVTNLCNGLAVLESMAQEEHDY